MKRIGTSKKRASGLVFVRWLIVAASALMAMRPSPVFAAGAANALSEPDEELELRVQIDERIEGAEEIRQWVEDEAYTVLDQLQSKHPLGGRLNIAIGGQRYVYQVTLTVLRDEKVVGEPDAWSCECSNDELLENLRTRLPDVVKLLEVAEESAPPPGDDGDPPEEPQPVMEDGKGDDEPESIEPRAKRPKLGAVGIALIAIGAPTFTTGMTLLVLGERPPAGPGAEREWRDYRPPGAIAAGTGLAVLSTGLTLYLMNRRSGRTERPGVQALAPSTGDGQSLVLTMSGSF